MLVDGTANNGGQPSRALLLALFGFPQVSLPQRRPLTLKRAVADRRCTPRRQTAAINYEQPKFPHQLAKISSGLECSRSQGRAVHASLLSWLDFYEIRLHTRNHHASEPRRLDIGRPLQRWNAWRKLERSLADIVNLSAFKVLFLP